MTAPRVELVYDCDCPNVEAARAALLRGFALAGLAPAWREWERGAAESPEYVQGFGSPTVLVNGCDVAPAPAAAGEASSCRLYEGDGGLQPTPSVERIAAALAGGGDFGGSLEPGEDDDVIKEAAWRGGAPALLGVGAALAPTCPACWPVYSAVLGTAGFGFVMQEPVLLPLGAGLLALTLVLLGWRARARHGFGPLLMGLAATAVVAAAKLGFESAPGIYAGLGLLAAASIWNGWPVRARGPACVACEDKKRSEEEALTA